MASSRSSSPDSRTQTPIPTTLRVVEGVAGTWFYHLREDPEPVNLLKRALCGAEVMVTQISLSAWDKTPKNYHIPERWCQVCGKLAGLSKENV